jgi:hypothetical protein
MHRPLTEESVGKPPARHHIDDMSLALMRTPMRRLGTTIAALSATTAWSFYRPGDRRMTRVASGCLSHQQSGIRLKSD